MRGKHLKTGIHGGGAATERELREQLLAQAAKIMRQGCGVRLAAFHHEHRIKLHEAVNLYAWLVGMQTSQKGGVGLVWRGHPFTYGELGTFMGEKPRTVRFWMDTLRRHGYVSVKYTNYKHLVIRILKAKKFIEKQMWMAWGHAENAGPHRHPTVSSHRHPGVYEEHPSVSSSKDVKNEYKKKGMSNRGAERLQPLGPPTEAELADRQAATMAARKALPVWMRREFQQVADKIGLPVAGKASQGDRDALPA
jgi:hypothetical protein